MAVTPTYQDSVAEVLDRWPNTAQVFIAHRMGCVGCAMARFETIVDAVDIYGLIHEDFLDELREAIQSMRTK